MNQLQPQFSIYPTILDAYDWFLKGIKEDGFQELIDKINRAPYEISEAAKMGTEFNNLIDINLKEGKKANTIEGFVFDQELVNEVLDCYSERPFLNQYFVDGTIETKHGLVYLYGYMDYVFKSSIRDLKTTKEYTLGKYGEGNQRFIYPYLIHQQSGIELPFIYDVVQWGTVNKPYVFTSEYYAWDPECEQKIRYNVECFIDFILQHKHLITDKKLFKNN